jgi:hypothetical protein
MNQVKGICDRICPNIPHIFDNVSIRPSSIKNTVEKTISRIDFQSPPPKFTRVFSVAKQNTMIQYQTADEVDHVDGGCIIIEINVISRRLIRIINLHLILKNRRSIAPQDCGI